MFMNIEKISSVECPVLIFHGKRDEVVPFDHGAVCVLLRVEFTGCMKCGDIPELICGVWDNRPCLTRCKTRTSTSLWSWKRQDTTILLIS